jgi:hypothetical protein
MLGATLLAIAFEPALGLVVILPSLGLSLALSLES